MQYTNTRHQLIVGFITRFDLDGIPLGTTRGDVVIRQDTQQMDVRTDLGVVINKFRTGNRWFVDVILAESTLRNLIVAWGGKEIPPEMDIDGNVVSEFLAIGQTVRAETPKELIIEGPGPNGVIRRYTFDRVVSLFESSQTLGRATIASLAVTFEALANTRRVGSEVIGERVVPEWIPDISVLKGNLVLYSVNDILYMKMNENDATDVPPDENPDFVKFNPAVQNELLFGRVSQGAYNIPENP